MVSIVIECKSEMYIELNVFFVNVNQVINNHVEIIDLSQYH